MIPYNCGFRHFRGHCVFAVFVILFYSCDISSDSKPPLEDIKNQLAEIESLSYTNADSAINLLSELHKKSELLSFKEGVARSNFLLGKIFLDIGGFGKSMKYLNNALLQYQEVNDFHGMAATHLLLSQVSELSSNFTESYQHIREAVHLYQQDQNKLGLANAYGTLGHFFEKTQSYDSAIYYQNVARRLYETENDTLGLARIHDNIGSIYEDLGIDNSAREHFEIAYRYNIAKGNFFEAIVNLNNLGDVQRRQNNLTAALHYSTMALELAKKSNNQIQSRNALRDLSKIYYQLNQSDTAFTLLEKSYQLTGEIFGAQTAEEIGKMKMIFDVIQKEEQISFLEQQRKQDHLLMTIVAVGILLLGVLGALLYYQTLQKSRKRRKILEIESELINTELENIRLNEQNLRKELENKRLWEKQLEQQLELKTRSLTTKTLQMIEKNEFLINIRKKLNELRKSNDPNTSKQVKRMIRSIDQNFDYQNDWAEFENVFEKVHSGFLENLRESHPNLSSAEIRLCVLIKLNLPSRNMATILGISPDSLRIARYRLRKKLGINKEEIDLLSHLRSIEMV